MSRLDRWLRQHGYDQRADPSWATGFPGHLVFDADRLPRKAQSDTGYVSIGVAVLLSGPRDACAGAWFNALEPASAWARSGRQSATYSYLEIRHAGVVNLWDENAAHDLRALILGEHLNRDDAACLRWAKRLDPNSSHWVTG
jgi:hypothetical protein